MKSCWADFFSDYRQFLKPEMCFIPAGLYLCVSAYVIMWLSDSGSIKTPSTYRGAKEKLWRSHFFPSSRLILHNKKKKKPTAVRAWTSVCLPACLSIPPRLSVVAKDIVFLFACDITQKQAHRLSSENKVQRNMMKDFRSFSSCLCWKMKHLESTAMWKIILTASWTTEQMFPGAGKFLKRWQNNRKERYGSGYNIRNRSGGFQITFLGA